MSTRTDYNAPEAGGSWEHRSGDCELHGENVSFSKPYGSSERYQCVQCMLYAARILRKREQFAAAASMHPERLVETPSATGQDRDTRAVKRMHKCPNAPHKCPK